MTVSSKPAPLDLEQFKGHTPSPWYAEEPWSGFSAIRGPSNELIFGLAAGVASEKQPDEVCEANAKLIASAPTLLARLKDAEEALENERTRIANAVIKRYATSKSFGNWSMLAEDTARFIMMLPPPDIARSHLQPGEKQ